MLKVLLINAPYIDLYGPIKLAAGRYFPLGLGYIASFLQKKGFQVLLYEPEAQNLNLEKIKDIFSTERPDVIGISSATPNFYNALRIAEIAKNSSNGIVIYGGVHASAIPEFIVEKYHSYFDYLVVGEGEYTMGELLTCLANKESPQKVQGLCYWSGGRVVRTDPRLPLAGIDNLPYPARDLIPQSLFRPNMHNAVHKKSFTILTSRGCPFNCSFCASYLTMGKRYRTHSAEYVLDEINFLKKRYDAKHLIINDDTFTLDNKRLIKICEGILKRNLNIKYFCFSQVSAVDKSILELMKKSGCHSIGFGVESASNKVLKDMGKQINFEKCREVVNIANKLGIKTQAFFVFGKKEEALSEMKKTIKYALELNPTLAFFNMLVPYPGTRDFKLFFDNIPFEDINWEDFVAIGTNSVHTNAKKQAVNLEQVLYSANLKFYMRPKQLFHILSKIKTLYELSCYLSGALGLILQMTAWKNNHKNLRPIN